MYNHNEYKNNERVPTSSESLAQSSFWLFIARWTGTAISLVTGIIIARCLGPDGKGRLALINSVASYFGQIVGLGLSVAIVYYIGRMKWSALWVLKTACSISFSIWIISVGFLAIGGNVLAQKWQLTSEDMQLLWLLMAFMPLGIVSGHLGNILRAFNFIVVLAWRNIVQNLTTAVLVFLLVFLLKGGLLGAIASNIGGGIVGQILIISAALRIIDWTPSGSKQESFWPLIIYSIGNYFWELLTVLVMRVDMWLVGYYLGPSQVGVYSIALIGSEFVPSIAAVIGYALVSRVARNSPEEALKTTIFAAKITRLSGIIIAIILIPLALLIPAIYGEAFKGALVPFYICLFGMIFIPEIVIIQNHLLGGGHLKPLIIGQFFTLIIEIVFNLIFIPIYQLKGAAVALSITVVFTWVIYIIIFYRIYCKIYIKKEIFLISYFRLNREDIQVLIKRLQILIKRKSSNKS
ncbi:MAG: oligosaccharide flippase family protein [Nitrososphaerota archaeon]